jgi:hypothetical protein
MNDGGWDWPRYCLLHPQQMFRATVTLEPLCLRGEERGLLRLRL